MLAGDVGGVERGSGESRNSFDLDLYGTTQGDLETIDIKAIEKLQNHRLIHIGGKNRACAYCTITKNKTRLGWARKSYYRCQICQVPLCRGDTKCYELYHQLVLDYQHVVRDPTELYKFLLRKFSVFNGPSS